jgi:predicted transcriptional regulator
MKLKNIAKLLEGKIVTSFDSDNMNVKRGFTSDLMSDVLTLEDCEDVILITGLANIQTIRTAEMAGLYAIAIVRGKKASEEMIELAEENKIIVIETAFSAFRTSAVLCYEAYIQSLY